MGKRKLNEDGVPAEDQQQNDLASSTAATTFEDFHLDPRLMQAIVHEKFTTPTPVQAQAIPPALEGRDVLARSKTGSGKTAAYVLPILQAILRRKTQQKNSKARSTSSLILVPTRELASQVTKTITRFASFCSKDIETVNLTPQISEQAQKALLVSSPDIVVTTPSRAVTHLEASSLVVDHLAHLVIDEADLVLSYEYGDDFDKIVKLIPQGLQCFLASATLSTDVDTLKGLFCRDPVILDLQEHEKESSGVSQYVVRCAEDEKFLILFALFKLKLVKGKCIVFVADTDRCYRVKLFLEQFGIKSCVLNSELPLNCRIHVVEEFNKGIYDIIIATDDHEIAGQGKKEKASSKHMAEEEVEEDDDSTHAANNNKNGPLKKRSKKSDLTYGISRGIDFQAVTCVLNFDLPPSPKSYTHRIGRTARAGRTGIAFSFAIPTTEYRKHKHLSHPSTSTDEKTLSRITASQTKKGHELQPYNLDMKKLTAFRYRVNSALQAVSPGAIREARLRELRQEMLKSDKLKRHLEENPDDLRYLRHDTELRPAKVQPHLRHVPDYLMPAGMEAAAGRKRDVGRLLGQGMVGGFEKTSENRIRKARERNRIKRRGPAKQRNLDPLKSFNAKGKKK